MLNLQRIIGTNLAALLAAREIGERIVHCERLQEACSGLEWFVPTLLARTYPEWEHECLDGIIPWVTRKSAEREVEILGACVLLPSRGWTPLHLRVQLSPGGDEVAWLHCDLGERGGDGLVRYPTEDAAMKKHAAALDDSVQCCWVYEATYTRDRF